MNVNQHLAYVEVGKEVGARLAWARDGFNKLMVELRALKIKKAMGFEYIEAPSRHIDEVYASKAQGLAYRRDALRRALRACRKLEGARRNG